jgi:hypothetical protein
VVLEFLAEAVHEPGEASRAHAERKVLPLNAAGIKFFWDRAARLTGTTSAATTSGRRITPLAFRCCSVDFDEHRKMHSIAERVVDGRTIGNKPISRDLEVARSGLAQAFDENIGSALIALADGDSENQFRLALDTIKGIAVAPIQIVLNED